MIATNVCVYFLGSNYVNIDDTIIDMHVTDTIQYCMIKIGKDDGHDGKHVVMDVAAKFHSLGCALGLHSCALDKIGNNNPHDSGKALGQVIDTLLTLRGRAREELVSKTSQFK